MIIITKNKKQIVLQGGIEPPHHGYLGRKLYH